MLKKRGQVWVETVLYTLLSLLMIGLVLAYAKPKIEEMQDKAVIEQTRKIIESIDATVLSVVQGGQGNKRIIELKIKEGELKIDSNNDKIIFELESICEYTEPGNEVSLGGGIKALTTNKGKFNEINLIKEYENYNITWKNSEEDYTITKAPTLYKMAIINRGNEAGGDIVIDFTLN